MNPYAEDSLSYLTIKKQIQTKTVEPTWVSQDPLITENLLSQEQMWSATLSGQKPSTPRDREQPLGSSSLSELTPAVSMPTVHCRTQISSFVF